MIRALLFGTGLAVLFGALGCVAPPATGPNQATAKTKPNIVFILTDDQGWATLGCYGGKHVPTPNLDRLAAEGVRFTDAYVMPQCTPTRAALLTGQNCIRNGMWHVIGWYGYPWAPVREPTFVENLPRTTFTLAKGLKAAGYTTACIGKWHLTHNADGHYVGLKPHAAPHHGFDYAPDDFPKDGHKTGDKAVNWLTDRALDFIQKNKDKPFFVYLAHHTIHGPVVAPKILVNKYHNKGYPQTGVHNATYLAALDHLDQSVGRLMKGLDDAGVAGNTIVVFLSDNGGVNEQYDPKPFQEPADVAKHQQLTVRDRQYDNAPLRAGKGSMYEGGIRVPAIVRWPGVAKMGLVSQTPIHVTDWMPTLLAAAGSQAPKSHTLDGVNLRPLLAGQTIQPRALYWHLPLYDVRWGLTPCAIIRQGDHKLIEFFGDRFDAKGQYVPGGHTELYDLSKDLGETTNLAEHDKKRVEEMRQQLFGWIKQFPNTIPGPNPHHDPKRMLTETPNKPKWLLKTP